MKKIIILWVFNLVLISNCNEVNFTGLSFNEDYIKILENKICPPSTLENESIIYLKRKLPNANKVLEVKLSEGLSQIEFFNFITSKEFNELMQADFELLNSGEQETCLVIFDFLNNLMRVYGDFFYELRSKDLITLNS